MHMLHSTHGSVPPVDRTFIHGDRYVLMVALHPSHGHFENFLSFISVMERSLETLYMIL